MSLREPETEVDRQNMVRRLTATLQDLEKTRDNAEWQASGIRLDLEILQELGREWRRNA